MNDPWFDPNYVGAIVGSVLGITGGIGGTLVGLFAPRGKFKKLVLGLHFLFMVACVLLLGIGMAAYFTGQPYGIYYGFGFPGLLGLVIFGALTPVVLKRYREAEMRRSIARDL